MNVPSSTSPTSTAADTSAAAGTDTSKNGLGRDAFLQLLVTQLQHQNPLEPQPDGEFLAQLAQFSSLESLQQIESDTSTLRALAQGEPPAQQPASSGGL